MKNALKLAILFFGSDCLASENKATTVIDHAGSTEAKKAVAGYLYYNLAYIFDDGIRKLDYVRSDTEFRRLLTCNEIMEYLSETYEVNRNNSSRMARTPQEINIKYHAILSYEDVYIHPQDEQNALWSMMAQAAIDNRPDVANFLLQNSKLFKDPSSR